MKAAYQHPTGEVLQYRTFAVDGGALFRVQERRYLGDGEWWLWFDADSSLFDTRENAEKHIAAITSNMPTVEAQG